MGAGFRKALAGAVRPSHSPAGAGEQRDVPHGHGRNIQNSGQCVGREHAQYLWQQPKKGVGECPAHGHVLELQIHALLPQRNRLSLWPARSQCRDTCQRHGERQAGSTGPNDPGAGDQNRSHHKKTDS